MRVEKTKFCTLYLADCCDVMKDLRDVDAVITDPPYGETSLDWDIRVSWQHLARESLKDTGSMWVFGSLRYFMESFREFDGWSMSQDVLWEKHNGTCPFRDRFRRVHEHAAHFYKSCSSWKSVKKNPLFTNDATAKVVRRKKRPPQWGDIGESVYVSHDGGPKLMRSVMFHRSCHGFAQHPTQKPTEIIDPLVQYSTNAGDVVMDPFMGSGSTGVSCVNHGRSFIGIESSEEFFGVALNRILEAEDATEQSASVNQC